MDGELSRETSLFVARRLVTDGELRGTWERYHLIRDCIRRPGGERTASGFSQRLSAALAVETAETRPAAAWLKPVSGLAIAASVALLAVVAVGPAPAPPTADALSGSASSQPFTSPNTLPAVPVSQPASFNAASQRSYQRLNSYLLRHNQLAGASGRQGFVSFVPIITADTAQAMDAEGPAETQEPDANRESPQP